MQSNSNDASPEFPRDNESEVMEVIRNRERAELLLIAEVKNATSEILMASSSLCYVEHLAELGLLDGLEQAKSRGVKIMILCPEVFANTPDNTGFQHSKLLFEIARYGQIRNITGQIRGTVVLVDNSKVLSISEEGIDALAIHSDNRSLVNNYASLFEALWVEQELLQSLIRSKNELVKSNEQLKLHDKMQRDFINIAAHELRTPVQPIIGMMELLGFYPALREDADDDEVTVKRSEMKMIARNAIRLERLSSDILDATRIESGKLVLHKQQVNLSDLVLRAIDDAAHWAKSANTKFEKYVSENGKEIIVDSDPERLMQIFSNLLSNAVKFTEAGTIAVAVRKQKGSVLVSVKDSGIGISPEMMTRLFGKFASSLDTGSGTGLGLYITKAIVEAHGGKIWAENNVGGNGATFYFTLPLHECEVVGDITD